MKNSSEKIEIAKCLQLIENEKIVASASNQIRSKKFENNTLPYMITLPAMWLLIICVRIKKFIYKILGLGKPKINSIFFDGLGKSSRKVKEYASSWKALDIVYNHPFSYAKNLTNIIDEYYWNGLNCQGLRNRRKLIKEELRKAILKQAENKEGEVKIISLACGSAEVLIELIAELKEKNIKTKSLLIDIDEDALKRALIVAKEFGVEELIKTEKNTVYAIKDISKEFNPDIIEMMGFLDYLKDEEAIKVTKLIKESLNKDGYFISCNINNNPEKEFLTWVIDWPMVYRNPEDLLNLGIKAEFEDNKVIYEPLKIHGILISKK
ncbi:class I SAM-dependent methyltransferase family protein [bacterium]|nr:class I SAM-dependent methyltransferase family protein [bacterium]